MEKTATFDSNMQLLANVLDLRARNQQVIASNIANAETPGYSPTRFQFEQELKAAAGDSGKISLETSHPQHIPLGLRTIGSVTGTLTKEHDQTGIGDENGVNVEAEMIALSENELMYEAAAQLLKKKLGMISYAVSGGQ